MRLARPLLIALAVLLPLTGAASAEARRNATHAERAAIAAKFDAPPKCAKVFVSTVDRLWALVGELRPEDNVRAAESLATLSPAAARRLISLADQPVLRKLVGLG